MTGPLLVIGVCNLLLAWMLWLTFKGHAAKRHEAWRDKIDAELRQPRSSLTYRDGVPHFDDIPLKRSDEP